MRGQIGEHVTWYRLALDILIAASIFIAVWVPRRMDLNRAVTTDEILWLERSKNFYFALKRGDFASTYQKEHPGVTIMWVGTIGLLNKYQDYLESNRGGGDQATINYYLRWVSEQNPLENLVEDRILLSLVQAITLTLAFWISRGVIGSLPAFIAFLLISFDPFHLALTRLLHLDGLLASLYLLSLIAFISFLKRRFPRDLIISGIAAGLCMLTKSPGFFLLPTIGILAFLDLLKDRRHHSFSLSSGKLWRFFGPYLIWILTAGLTFIILWPAMWVDPINVFTRILNFAKGYATEGHDTTVFFNGYLIESGSMNFRFAYFYPLTYLWRTTPVTLLGLFAFGWVWLINRNASIRPATRHTMIGITIGVLIFAFAMTLGTKKFDRYLLPVHVLIDILAGLGWIMLVNWICQKLSGNISRLFSIVGLSLVVGAQMISALSIFPYDLSYYNPLLGGSLKAPQVMQIGWGEGLDQAALYLNQKDHAKDLKVMSWYAWGPFSFFFDGQVKNIRIGPFTNEDWQELNSSDYVVIYVHQWQRKIPEELLEFLSQRTPEHTILINKIVYAQIYRIH